MIKYVKGEILKTGADAIAHGLAPNDNFKQGLALSLRERWPSLYKDFKNFCYTTHPKEGTTWDWKGVGSPIILNLFTQEHPKTRGANPGKANIQYVNHSLKEMKKKVKEYDLKSISLTRLATGVGGLDWEDVKPAIENSLSDLGILCLCIRKKLEVLLFQVVLILLGVFLHLQMLWDIFLRKRLSLSIYKYRRFNFFDIKTIF